MREACELANLAKSKFSSCFITAVIHTHTQYLIEKLSKKTTFNRFYLVSLLAVHLCSIYTL